MRTRLENYIVKTLCLDKAILGKEYYYASLPLCIIDSVFSIGVRYAPESNTSPVKNWCRNQKWPRYRQYGSSPQCVDPTNNVENFIRIISSYTFKDLSEKEVFNNKQRNSAKEGILKAEAVYHFAKTLDEEGINDFQDTTRLSKSCHVEKRIRSIKGQKSGISLKYFLMLAGDDTLIKADRMVCRFVAEATGQSGSVKADMAENLISEVCEGLQRDFPGLTPRRLDHAIWNYQRTRPA
jgi:hypothetical protein